MKTCTHQNCYVYVDQDTEPNPEIVNKCNDCGEEVFRHMLMGESINEAIQQQQPLTIE